MFIIYFFFSLQLEFINQVGKKNKENEKIWYIFQHQSMNML